MIRAHLATFPPRAGILGRVVEAIRPQVDHLFVVLNGYDAVPDTLIADDITAIIPDRDVKDAGKFWFTPEADDIVFLIDDDLGYPPDYVARSIAGADKLGWDRGAFGHLGIVWRDDRGARGPGWHLFKFTRKVGASRGMDAIGTGTTVVRGALVPPLTAIEPFAGSVDIGFADYLRARGCELWLLAHDADWLTNELPDELRDTSLFQTAGRRPDRVVRAAVNRLARNAPANRDLPFHTYAPSLAPSAIH